MDITLNMDISTKQMHSNSGEEKQKLPLTNEKHKSALTTGFKPITFQNGVQKIKAVALRKRRINKLNIESPNVSQVLLLANETERQMKETPESFQQINDSDLMLNISVATSFTNTKVKNRERREQHLSKLCAEHGSKNVTLGLNQRDINSGITHIIENTNKHVPRASDRFKLQLDENCHQRKWSEKKKKIYAPVVVSSLSVQQPMALDTVDDGALKANCFKAQNKINMFHKMDNTVPVKLGQRCVMPIKEHIFNGAKVDSLGLHRHAVKNLADLFNITELTTVQQKTIPKALEGKDLIVRSQTGSGKTLAYALPIIEKLQQIRPKIVRSDGILSLIIVPTRELAIQTYELVHKLLKPYTWLVSGVLIGGESRKSEKARLRKGINILIGTPGRLVDHLLNTTSFKLSKTVFLVLDEADRLLEMGYEHEVQQIVEGIDKHRAELVNETNQPVAQLNRFLLSATLTPAVQKLAGLTLNDPIFIDNSEENTALALHSTEIGHTKISTKINFSKLHELDDVTSVLSVPENLLLSYIIVPPKMRLVTFVAVLAKEFMNRQKFKAMVFMSTTEMVNYHHDLFNEAFTSKIFEEDDEETEKNLEKDRMPNTPLLHGLRLFKLNGSMTQTERQGVFKGFRDCLSGVLLTTDVVCRGIDVPDVNLVVQYSPPHKTADFVHRVGRTARAGRSGRAVLFLTNSELQFIRNLEDKRLRIIAMDINNYLQSLVDADPASKNIQQAVSNLQYKFQELIADDKELHEKSCKAFVSWIKYYTAFPKELKSIFNIKNAHMGHFAKSFGLNDEPTSFVYQHSQPKVPRLTNRLTYTERDSNKMQHEGHKKRRLYTTTVTKERRNIQQYADGNLNFAKATTLRSTDSRDTLLYNLPKSRSLNISEFDNGLPMAKKRKTESK